MCDIINKKTIYPKRREKKMDMLNLSKEQSMELLDLRKERVSALCLEKKQLQNLTSRVGVVMDFSGSMEPLYKNGTVQAVLERLFPIALQFDDNGEMEMWIFDSTFHRLPNITMENYYGYIDREVIGKYNMGGTRYAPVLMDVFRKYMIEEPAELPNYIMYLTDGDNSDKTDAANTIMEMSNYPIFLQFVGLKHSGSYGDFEFLRKLDTMGGRYVDNANFFNVDDINSAQDGTLYEMLLNEYPQWLDDPKVKEIIRKCSSGNEDIFNGGGQQRKKGFFGKLFG